MIDVLSAGWHGIDACHQHLDLMIPDLNSSHDIGLLLFNIRSEQTQAGQNFVRQCGLPRSNLMQLV